MSNENTTERKTLADEEIVSSRAVSRRSLIAIGIGAAAGAATLLAGSKNAHADSHTVDYRDKGPTRIDPQTKDAD